MSSFTGSEPGAKAICIAVPGHPIPIVDNLPVIIPALWPKNQPAIYPPYVDRLPIYGGRKPPYMDVVSTSGGTYLVLGARVVPVILVSVNWPLAVLTAKKPVLPGWCPVLDEMKKTIHGMRPVTVIAPVRVPLRKDGVFVRVVEPEQGWPILDWCPPCPLSDGEIYGKVRNKFPNLPDTEYYRVARQSGLLWCPMEGDR